MLHEFIAQNRAEIVRLCRSKAAVSDPRPTAEGLESGVPLFLDQLMEILRLQTLSSPQIRESAARQGEELLRLGFTVGQVVHGYGDVCQAITELALDRRAPISTEDFRALNRCLDDAIANAVTEYSKKRDDQISADGTERLAIFAHELRNLLNSATLSFEVLRTGRVGVGGSSGQILARSLSGLRALINRSLVEGRISAGIQQRERIAIPQLIREIEASALLEADARNVQFTVACGPDGATVDADRQILGSVVGNLLQNAFKFSRPEGHVRLRTSSDADGVEITVEDECGGLPEGDARDLFRPFAQGGHDRSGLGLGLAISRRGVEASGGELDVRDLPGVGCVFTVKLPRSATGPVAECPA